MNAVKISRQCSVNSLPLGREKKDCMLMAVYLNCKWKNILTRRTSRNIPSCTPVKQAEEVPEKVMSTAAAK